VVIIHRPFVSETKLLEGHIEGNTVTIPLGVDDHAVLIEEYSFYFSHAKPPNLVISRDLLELVGAI
jgi:hypothetical protein